MTLLIVLVVVAIIGGTWVDWQEVQRHSRSPEWISGIAMAGLVAACLTTFTLVFPLFAPQAVEQPAGGVLPTVFWARIAFALSALGLAVASVRRERLQIFVFLIGLLMASFCLGFLVAS